MDRGRARADRRAPATRAPDLAASLGRETAPFKADVRKLKELGLTESLLVGYRLSPRGRAYLPPARLGVERRGVEAVAQQVVDGLALALVGDQALVVAGVGLELGARRPAPPCQPG